MNVTDPAVTMQGIQVSANLLFGKLINNLAVVFLVAGIGLLGFLSYWYFRVKRR